MTSRPSCYDPSLRTPRVSIVHDFMVTRGGAERVAIALAQGIPHAPLVTSLYDPNLTFSGVNANRIQTLGIDRLRPLRRNYRWSLPLAGGAFARHRVDADVVICTTSGFAHHVTADVPKIVYCHSPARWLHNTDAYLSHRNGGVRRVANAAASRARAKDIEAMSTASVLFANSRTIANEIGDIYGISARVLAPPSSLDLSLDPIPVDGVSGPFVLTPCRALGYKRLGLLLEAAARRPDLRFVHVGSGPEHARLKQDAPSNVFFAGEVKDAQLLWCYQQASAVVLTAADDYGLVPDEAAALGVPSVVPAARGFLDHVKADVTGIFYEDSHVASLCDALDDAIDMVLPQPGEDPLRVKHFVHTICETIDEVLR